MLGSRSVRNVVTGIFSPKAHPYRFAALLTSLLLNFKSLPSVWHIRLFGPMYYQLFLQPKPLPRDALFRPMITRGSRTSLPETDYNLHKSNSTYFADLDIGRTMLISCLLRKGIRESSRYKTAGRAEVEEAHASTTTKRRRSSIPGVDALRVAANTASEVATAETTLRTPHSDGASPPTAKKSDRFLIALGGVSCHFKRELKPYEEYEIWTRVLSWDRKWIYLVSHMVKAGAVRPDEYALGRSVSWSERLFGAGRRRSGNKGEKGALEEMQREQKAEWQKAIFASSISKYVVKKGRLTIPPELVWKRSDLLPSDSDGPSAPVKSGDDIEASDGVKLNVGNDAPRSDTSPEHPYAWTSANVERERLRGMKLAGSFAALDDLVEEFPTSWGLDEVEEDEKEVKVLGSFQDWLVF